MQAENRIDWDRSVRPDRCVNWVRKPVHNEKQKQCVNREAVEKIFRVGIYFGS